MSRRRVRDQDRQELDHARRLIRLRIAAVTTIVMLFVGAVVYAVMITAQNNSADRELHWVATYGDPERPPPCTWLVVRADGRRLRASPDLPRGFPLRDSLDQVAATGETVRDQRVVDNVRYRVLTTRLGDKVVQAVYDARFQDRARNQLLVALAVAEALGVLGAMLAGGLLARRAMLPLAEALRRQRQFVADASHELRTPVTRLHTRAQLLARRSAGRPDQNQVDQNQLDLTRLVADTRQLGDIIDDLLLATRIRNGHQSIDATAEVIDLATLANEVAEAEAARAAQAGVAVEVLRGPGPYTVLGVRTALLRVLGALLDNALGHTRPGGRITLTVAGGPADTVTLRVDDDGEGFDERDAERLFERFARGTSGNGSNGGNTGKTGNTADGRSFGIGLSLVREVVRNHRGTVTATGVPGRGASFTVTLPAAPRSGTAQAARAALGPPRRF